MCFFFDPFRFILKAIGFHLANHRLLKGLSEAKLYDIIPSRFCQPVGFTFGRDRRPAGRSSAAPVSSAAPKKKHLIEAVPFGRLDQMLQTTV